MKLLPVYLVTGFLGSGKSTLLEHLITAPDFPSRQTALIINDAGIMNVDAQLFRDKVARISALTGGCACCASPMELITQLKTYAADPAIEQVWIEASGIANPEDLLDCLTGSELLGKIELRQIIYVLDAENFPRWRRVNLWIHENQVRWADVVIVNKIDRVSPEQLAEVCDWARSCNPSGALLESAFGRVQLPATGGIAKTWQPGTITAGHVSMKAFFVPMPEPVDREELTRVLQTLPDGVCRAKGFVRFRSVPTELYVVHQVGKSAPAFWRYDSSVPATGMVIIGLDLDLQLVRRELKSLATKQ